MTYEARVTVHQRGLQKPDYTDIHRRMAKAGYLRVIQSGGHLLNELHGMYRKVSFSDIDVERANIERELQSTGFSFSIELFHIDATRTFNLEPAQPYSLLGALYGTGSGGNSPEPEGWGNLIALALTKR